jgi:hypothetical protein
MRSWQGWGWDYATFVGSGLQTHIQKYLIAQVLGYVNDFDL